MINSLLRASKMSLLKEKTDKGTTGDSSSYGASMKPRAQREARQSERG